MIVDSRLVLIIFIVIIGECSKKDGTTIGIEESTNCLNGNGIESSYVMFGCLISPCTAFLLQRVMSPFVCVRGAIEEAVFRELLKINTTYKWSFVNSVIYENSAIEDLLLFLNWGNDKVIPIILGRLEAEKNETNVKAVLVEQNNNLSYFFFSRYHYEICANIEIALEKNTKLFISASERIKKYLEIPPSSHNVIKNSWRDRRLNMTKLYLKKSTNPTNFCKDLVKETFDVFHHARMALDTSMSKSLGVYEGHFPFAYKKITDKERKKAGCNYKYDQERRLYLKRRLNETWLPHDKEFKLGYKVIEGLLREGFSSLKCETKIPDDILKFFARREHHIITKEAAWHAFWIDNDNDFKHNEGTWDVNRFENELNEYRNISGLLFDNNASAYDIAHRAAEFAEQTVSVFNKEEP